MFVRNDHVMEGSGGGSALAFGRAMPMAAPVRLADTLTARFGEIDLVPDLGSNIGTRDWWRGAATCAALIAATIALAPGFDRPTYAAPAAVMEGADFDEARTQGIAPLAYGATTGRRLAPTALVTPLTDTPERPILELTTTLPSGPSLAAALERAGVGDGEADRIADLVASRVALDELKPGTQLELTLGRRPTKSAPRPVEALSFRARFDLAMKVARDAGTLVASAVPIAIDNTPLRIQGRVGPSLYRSARAAGAPARVVEAYIKALATRLSIGRDVGAADSFDLIVARDRAATGEQRLGDLLFAGIDQGRRKVELVRWDDDDGRASWFDAKGQSERRGFMGMPVAGRITSSFGYRMHPLLGYLKMHKGLDIGAPYGSPIYAVLDGVVQGAGRSGGYGNFVKLGHAGGLASGYGHMSRIAVARGQHVRQGQVIGYVGSTGLSTGPHLHWEVWRNGQTVNPRSISFASVAALSGNDLRRFRAYAAGLLAVPTGTR